MKYWNDKVKKKSLLKLHPKKKTNFGNKPNQGGTNLTCSKL